MKKWKKIHSEEDLIKLRLI